MAGILPAGGWGPVKPPVGTQIAPGHPLADRLQLDLLFNEGGGRTLLDGVHKRPIVVGTGGAWRADLSGTALSLEPPASSYYLSMPALGFAASASVTFMADLTLVTRNWPSNQALLNLDSDGDGSGVADWNLSILTATAEWSLYATDSGGASKIATLASPAIAVAGTRYLIVGRIRDGGTVDLFVNGVKTVGNAITTRRTSFSQLQIGRFNGTYGQYGGGEWHLFRAWSKALTDYEILTLSKSPYGIYAPPVWRRYFVPATGGGTTQNLNVSGSVTPSGALVKQEQKRLAGTATPAGTIARLASTHYAGGSTPAGALTKTPAKVFAGAVSTITGALARTANKVFAGGATPTGALAKTAAKVFAGALSSIAGALTNTSTRSVNLSGTLTSAGACVKQARKAASGMVTPTGSLLKLCSSHLSGALTPSGIVAKMARKVFTGAISTITGALVKTTARFIALAGTVTPSGALAKTVGIVRAGSVAPTGALVRSVSAYLSGGLTPSGTVAKTAITSFAGAVSGLIGSLVATFLAGVGIVVDRPARVTLIETRRHTVAPSEALVHTCTLSEEAAA